MITWLQTTFQKHHKLMFSVLLGVVVITFVLTIGPQSFFGSGRGEERVEKKFFSIDLASEQDVRGLLNTTRISASLNPYDTRLFRNRTEDYAYARAAALGLADQLGVPGPDEAQFQAYLKSRPVFQGENGQYDPEILRRFNEAVQSNSLFQETDVVQALVEDWRIERVGEALGGAGYVQPFEARFKYVEDETLWSIDQATLDYGAFSPEITPDETALQAFYDANPNRYEQGEMVRTSLVEFPLTAFQAKVPAPAETDLQTYFEANQWRFQKPPPPPAEGETPPAEPPRTTLEEVRPEVTLAWQEDRARRLAAEAADTFTVKLFRGKIARGSPAFAAALAEAFGTQRALQPYPQDRLPLQEGLSPQVLAGAFQMDEANYYSDIVPTRVGAAVLIFEEKVPSRLPTFAEVRERVATDYREEERRRLFTERGTQLQAELATALLTGQSFTEAAEARGLALQSFEDFKGLNPPNGMDRELFEQARGLEQGAVTAMVFQGNQGTFLHLRKKEVPVVALDAPEVEAKRQEMNTALGLADFWSLLAEYSARERDRLEVPKGLLSR